MKGSFCLPALVLVVFSVGCAGPGSPTAPSVRSAFSGAGLASQSSQSVPFKGSFEGSQTVTPLQPPLAAIDGSATGTGTHLGQFTVTFPHTVNFATRTGVGTYTFTAANGDTLTGDFTGQAQGAPPLVSIVEQVTVTGGTGRFAGATGTFTVQRQFNQSTGATQGSFEGEISSVGSK
jgi:hypothetical protein